MLTSALPGNASAKTDSKAHVAHVRVFVRYFFVIPAGDVSACFLLCVDFSLFVRFSGEREACLFVVEWIGSLADC